MKRKGKRKRKILVIIMERTWTIRCMLPLWKAWSLGLELLVEFRERINPCHVGSELIMAGRIMAVGPTTATDDWRISVNIIFATAEASSGELRTSGADANSDSSLDRLHHGTTWTHGPF